MSVAKQAVVLVSGGMDSSTLLWKLVHEGVKSTALSIHYGQRHEVELDAAHKICQLAGVPHTEIDLRSVGQFLKGSSQTDPSVAVPQGRYDDPSMKVTVVPNRNMMMLSIAAAFGIGQGIYSIAYAAHAGDHAIYPDCRPEFVESMKLVLSHCDYKKVKLLTPFLKSSKANIVKAGTKIGMPFEKTWSCYSPIYFNENGDEKMIHCGKCGTCVERREAFRLAKVEDPTQYSCAWEETEALLSKTA